jgi:hypothetical protein
MNQFRRNQHFSLKIWKGSIETVVPEYLLFSIVHVHVNVTEIIMVLIKNIFI